jgi:hypothetical protein
LINYLAHPRKLISLMIAWVIMISLTFQLRYFELYLSKERHLFGDFKAILACSNFKFTNHDSVCEVYMYGRYLRQALYKLDFLHSQTNFIITFVILAFLFMLSDLFIKMEKSASRLLLIVLLLSPSIGLLMQRGNLDILVFMLCWLSVNFYFKKSLYFSISLALIASMIKIYPIALLIILVLHHVSNKVSLRSKILLFLVTAFGMVSSIIDIRNIPWLPSDGRNSFGLRIFGEYVTYLIFGSGYQMYPVLGSMIGILAMAIAYYSITTVKLVRPSDFPEAKPVLRVWLAFFLLIFASGISVDYRLVFLLPFVQLLNFMDRKGRIVFSLLLISTFYFSFPFELLQIVGDLSLFLLLAQLFVFIYGGLSLSRLKSMLKRQAKVIFSRGN